MARFLTPIPSGSSGATTGERRLAERLKTLLEDDYLCWFNVPVGPQRLYPDFVILHPGRGIWILEVKDWKRDSIRSLTNHKVELLTQTGRIKSVANPIEQARQYCLAIVNRLSADPQLQEMQQSQRGKLCFPYAYAAVFTHITRRQMDEALSQEEQDLVLPPRLVIYKDEMLEHTPAEAFQERLWHMFHYRFGRPLTLPQVERVRWHLFPEIRLTSVQQDFFSDRSENETAEDPTPELIRIMDLQQEQLARNLGDGHRVIHGVAGSGKTLILGYRCLHLARMLHKPILVLCFNITLAARLRAFVNERGIDDRVRVHHFHEWCSQQLQAYHVPCINGEEPYYVRQVESVIQGVERGHIPRAQYGAVMIDEGHDFEPEWLRLVTQMTDPTSDSLLLLYDDAQSIYRKKNALAFSLSSVGIKAQGRTTILRLNYRNSREILQLASRFCAAFLQPGRETGEDHIPLITPESVGITGPTPHFQFEPNFQHETEWAGKQICQWLSEGVPAREIAVLTFRKKDGETAHQHFIKLGLPSLWMGSPESKSAYSPQRDEIAILSAQSSKGLEFSHVIILGLGRMDDTEDHTESNARLLYVAMTRSRHTLLLTASRPNRYTRQLEALLS